MHSREKEGEEAPSRMSAMERFLQNLVDQRPAKRRSPGVAGFLSKQGVGHPDPNDPRWILYGDDDFARAEALLRSEGLPPLKAERPTAKPIRRSPESHRNLLVAVSNLNGGPELPRGVRFLAMAACDAAAMPHEVLLVCQDIRVLQRIREFTWLQDYLGGRSALVLFRGGAGVSGFRVAACEAAMRESKAPVLAIVDVDTTGLVAAARLERLERLCVPSWPIVGRLLAASKATPAPRRHPLLEMPTHEDVARAWRLLRQYSRGVSSADFPVRADSITCAV